MLQLVQYGLNLKPLYKTTYIVIRIKACNFISISYYNYTVIKLNQERMNYHCPWSQVFLSSYSAAA